MSKEQLSTPSPDTPEPDAESGKPLRSFVELSKERNGTEDGGEMDNVPEESGPGGGYEEDAGPKPLKSAVELALEREGMPTSNGKPLKNAEQLAMDRNGSQSMAMEQNRGSESTDEPVRLLDADPSIKEALDVLEGSPHLRNDMHTSETNEASGSGASAENADNSQGVNPEAGAGTDEAMESGVGDESELLKERQQRLNEFLLKPASLRGLRKELHDHLSREGIADEQAMQQAAGEFIDNQFDEYIQNGQLSDTMRKWLSKILTTSEERFNEVVDDEQELGADAEAFTDNENTESNPLLKWPVRIKDWKDRLKEGFRGEENRRHRLAAYSVGALAVASTMALAYRTGVNTGVEEGMAEGLEQGLAEGQEQIEAQENVIDRQGDVIDRQQDVIEDLREDLNEAPAGDEGETDISSRYEGLPEGYLMDTPEGYEVTAMEGGETDSLWKAAEHSLRDTLGREPSTPEINQLQNRLGNRWLEVGETVNIPDDLIEESLHAAGTH